MRGPAIAERSGNLNVMTTCWTEVHAAHHGAEGEATAARRMLAERYAAPARRYLLKILKDPEAADDLAQEFLARFLAGAFHRADPERGRFRDFLKRSLYHLAVDYLRQQRHRHAPLPSDFEPVAAEDSPAEAGPEFLQACREELLAVVWQALADQEQRTGQPFYTVLRFRAEHPSEDSAEMAARLGIILGRPLTAVWVRQTLHRARERFAALLLEELARRSGIESADELEQELVELDLLEYCRTALAAWRGRRTPRLEDSPRGVGGVGGVGVANEW